MYENQRLIFNLSAWAWINVSNLWAQLCSCSFAVSACDQVVIMSLKSVDESMQIALAANWNKKELKWTCLHVFNPEHSELLNSVT